MTAIAKAQVDHKKVDRKKYSKLLARTVPCAITTEEENERMLAIVNGLMKKGEDGLTPEEDLLLELLFTLIEKFEEGFYQIERKSTSTPASMLKFLMEARDLNPKDLWPVLGSKGLTSEILSGRRSVSKSKAKALAEFFHVSVEVFI